ncbi:MAG: hypothetical protein NWF05_04430 [Candidatus Bathyarchaeota archaeon]|nr:hypothetical protein [Candidatus Bathyarchaeota archaeon]
MVTFVKAAGIAEQKPSGEPAHIFKKALAIILLVSLAVAIIALASPFLTSLFNETPEQSTEYTTLNLALYQSVDYDQKDTHYVFSYFPAGQQNLFQVTSENQTQSFPALTGASYNALGLEIKVDLANEGLIFLQVKPTNGS